MSFEVDFSFDDDSPIQTDIEEFFRQRRWYEVDDGGAEYADIDTGVAFEVRWEREPEVDRVVFELREGRPRIYGREAGEEIEAFADAFSEDFDVDQFREEWETANRGVIESGGAGGEQHLVEGERLEAAWEWNRVRRQLQEDLAGSMFVPRILFFRDEEGLQRGVIWPDAIPMTLPEVEFVLISVPEHVDPSQDASSAHRISYEEFVEAASEVAEEVDDPAPHLQLRWSEAPTDLVQSLTDESTIADPDDLTGLAIDRIFEASLLQSD